MESSSCLLKPLPLTGQELVRDLVIMRNIPRCLLGGEEAASPVKSQRPREFQKQRSRAWSLRSQPCLQPLQASVQCGSQCSPATEAGGFHLAYTVESPGSSVGPDAKQRPGQELETPQGVPI